MKNRLAYLLGIIFMFAVAVGCSEDTVESPTISFRRSLYILPGTETLKVEIMLSEPAAEDFAVDFVVGGDAVEGTDYMLSSQQFEVKQGEESASIDVIPVSNFNSGLELNLTLKPATGYSFGYYSKTMIPIEARSSYVAKFLYEHNYLYQEAEVAGELYIGTSKYSYPSYDIEVPFEVDPELSTAVLGEHYEIVGDKMQMLFKPNTYCPTALIKFLKYEPGKDLIVLRMSMSDKFKVSNKKRMYINIVGPITTSSLDGEWTFTGLSNLADITTLAKMAGWDDGLVGLPEGTAGEVVSFETLGETTYLNTSQLTSNLKDYFAGESIALTSNGIMREQLYEDDAWLGLHHEVLNVSLDANVNFSATSTKMRTAKMDVRLIDGGNTLELRVYDYEPTDFLTDAYAYLNKLYGMKQDYTLVYRFERKN